jgi:hypothetical protein
MVCYAEINKQIRPTGGISGMRPFCVATSVGFSCWSNQMELLKCSACGLLKLENEFSRNRYKVAGKGNRQALYGRTYDCLACIRVKRKVLHKRNPQIALKRNARKREIYATEEFKAQQRKRYYKKRYGITIEQYEKMLKAQNGVCAICGENNNHKTQRHLHIDHNHQTGKVRGLLCIRCNTIIGNSKENTEILKKAIEYIYRHLEVT